VPISYCAINSANHLAIVEPHLPHPRRLGFEEQLQRPCPQRNGSGWKCFGTTKGLVFEHAATSVPECVDWGKSGLFEAHTRAAPTMTSPALNGGRFDGSGLHR